MTTSNSSYPLFIEDSQSRKRILQTIRPTFHPQVQTRWEDFLEASREANCSIVAVRNLTPAIKRRLFRFCVHPTLRPMVLATDFTEDNARVLPDLCIDEVVWLHRLETTLIDAIRRSEKRLHLVVLAEAIQRNTVLPHQLRSALAAACTSPQPLFTQKELLEFVHCHRSTLFRQWRSVADSQTSLKTVLDWIVLLRACTLRETATSWNSVAVMLRIPVASLSATARRLTRSPLGKLELAKVKTLFDRSPVSKIILSQGPRPRA